MNLPSNSPFGKLPSGLASMADPQLDLRPDKSFTLYLSMAPIDGQWKLENGEVILSPKKLGGMSPEQVNAKASEAMERAKEQSTIPLPFPVPSAVPGIQEMRVKVLNDGEQLTLDPAAGTLLGGMGKITFKKV